MCPRNDGPPTKTVSTTRWLMGMAIATFYCMSYILTGPYIIAAILAVVFGYPSRTLSWAFATPLVLSIFSKPMVMYGLVSKLTPMLDYFDYEEVCELSDEDLKRQVYKEKKNYIFACQPHGVFTLCGMCSAIRPDSLRCPTAVASVVLHTPILKNLLGIFHMVDASGPNFTKHIRKEGAEGCVALYIGGIAELFKCCREEERLYIKNRKGFVKVALREGVDIVPVYLFGNTSVLSILKTGYLAQLSRKLQVALTYFWGKYYLPIPRDDKLMLVRGKPLGLPHIPNPTDEDVDKWHAKYCEQVQYLFEKYKEKVPMYKHKKLFID